MFKQMIVRGTRQPRLPDGSRGPSRRARTAPGCAAGFTVTDLLVVSAVIALLTAIFVPTAVKLQARSRQQQCTSNLGQVGRAILLYAEENKKTFPLMVSTRTTGVWWWYKELVKSYAGLTGQSSPRDKVFACPKDRGFAEDGTIQPFCRSEKYDYGSYVFNGVNLPGVPNIAGQEVASVKEPDKTLLVMEWPAHAPLSWHKSKTGNANSPFYNDAQSVVAFVDGHVRFIKIYYDGINAAYTREPIAGYDYKFSGD
jgi:prepilin-type processing-associated H-X9-DG protein